MKPDPTPLMQMMQGNQASAVLRAGIELAVFDAVAEGPAPADAIARARGTDSRGMAILLDALTALGLLAREDDRYSLTPLSDTFLRSSQPTYLGGLSKIFSSRHLGAHLDKLTAAVEQGGNVMDQHAETPEHPFWIHFAQGSAAMAGPGGQALAAQVAPWLGEREAPTVLDVACGSGLYGYSVAAACERATVVSQDWPRVLDETRAYAARMNLEGRASYLPGDLFAVDFGGPYDLVIASHIFHHFDEPTNQGLLRKIAGATKAGGKIAIHEFVTGEAPPSEDPGPYLFSAMMLSWTRKGQAYSRRHYEAWLSEVGFDDLEITASQGASTKWLTAVRR